jgi:hypothetical protein
MAQKVTKLNFKAPADTEAFRLLNWETNMHQLASYANAEAHKSTILFTDTDNQQEKFD